MWYFAHPTLPLITMAAALFALSLIQAPGAAQEPAENPSIIGAWALIGPAAAEERRNTAINEAIADLFFIGRPIARRRMRNELPVHRRVAFSQTAAGLRAQIGDYDFTFPTDGSVHSMRDPWDNDIRVSQQLQGRILRQTLRAENGVLYHAFRATDDGQRLTLSVRVTSPRLPADARYRYTYRRAS